MKLLKLTLITLIAASLLTACSNIRTAIFDQYSYQKAVEIKIDALNLMAKSVDDYTTHTEAIENLHLDLDKILAYELDKPDNNITYQMWQLIASPDKNLLGGYLKRWEAKGNMSPVFITEAKGQVTEAFDALIKYESSKDKEAQQSLLAIIANNL